ncbi:hypothetical protein Pla108_30100 [Botrimarina colliarenosi]|uniref:Tetratricopeptide repeat-like domain-containing protein n=1 Tax=Botrimarina colliarenosi TaxID=2528001 RepID=A0A5C6ACF7_9BACT|nr:tetratricopeptide repeat protein [Botrimarina colliarenosi]TWT95933.1 hypothetical protein Pla108_30100 [Botrimarina colliarenosi]
MDSEHRHELEENALAGWLSTKIDETKPYLPAIALGVVVLVAGLIGFSGWKTANASAKADRWRDFTVALEQGNPDLVDLKTASEQNPGTAVADWADVTWADGKVYQASQIYFRDRSDANEAVDEAVEVYERLVKSGDRDVAERATFQLGRALELQGKLDEAAKQYARVTGAFAQVAKSRIEQLETPSVKEAYDWITATKTASASSTVDTSGGLLDSLDPDDLPLPEVSAEEADATLDSLLQGVDEETEADMADADMTDDAPADDESAADETAADEASVDEAADDESTESNE